MVKIHIKTECMGRLKMLKVLFRNTQKTKFNLRESMSLVIKEVSVFW